MRAQLVSTHLATHLLLLICLSVRSHANSTAAGLPHAAAPLSKQQEVTNVPVSHKLTTTATTKSPTPTPPPPSSSSSSSSSSTTTTIAPATTYTVQKCTRQSMLLARQTLAHQLDTINAFNAIWFNDLDKDELIEEQRAALANIIVSGLAHKLLDADGQPMFELEASYFRSLNTNQFPVRLASPTTTINHGESSSAAPHSTLAGWQPISIKLIRRHADRCFLHKEKNHYTYLLGLTLGPIEHHLDVAYNLPKEFRLGQPIGWRYAQLRVLVPKMSYEVSLKQAAHYNLTSNCPLEVAELAFLGSSQPSKLSVAVVADGLVANNQTLIHLERLFNDYTRPTISRTLRQVLKFYLNSKTLPLAVS